MGPLKRNRKIFGYYASQKQRLSINILIHLIYLEDSRQSEDLKVHQLSAVKEKAYFDNNSTLAE